MDTPAIRIISQAGIYATFALYLLWTLRQGQRSWIPLVGTVIYAIVFEHFNMLRYAHTIGGYYYHPQSWLFLWHDVPLYIPLAWAFIVATSRQITDRLGLAEWSRPYCDALLALLIDLSLDVVAIRLNFWYWRGVGRNDAFFGVPADNFLGWLLVTFTFSLLTRRLWRQANHSTRATAASIALQWLLIPPAAYLLYLGLEGIVHVAYRLCGAQSLRGQFTVLSGVIALFLAAVTAGSRAGNRENERGAATAVTSDEREPVNLRHSLALHGPRHIFHVFGLIGLLCIPVAARNPALWIITLSVWATEWIISRTVVRRG